MTYWNNQWVAGDFQTGKLWLVDWDYTLEGDTPFVSERTTGVLSDNQNLVLVPRMELVMETGQDASNGVDAAIRMQYSDDGGYNWSNWVQSSIGYEGQYRQRVVFTRLGKTRQRVFRVKCSSARKRDILGASVVVQGTIG